MLGVAYRGERDSGGEIYTGWLRTSALPHSVRAECGECPRQGIVRKEIEVRPFAAIAIPRESRRVSSVGSLLGKSLVFNASN